MRNWIYAQTKHHEIEILAISEATHISTELEQNLDSLSGVFQSISVGKTKPISWFVDGL